MSPVRTAEIEDLSAVGEQLDGEARRRFRERYPDLRVAPVAVVIPAFDEQESIAGVLEAIPSRASGLALDVIVVDDGSSDATAQIALDHGARVARLERNSGQGAALRVGYRLAREHGARFVVTLDADGQWDPADIASVLQPVVDGEADLVLGSRVLGEAHAQDALRSIGVRVFAALLRLLTGVRLTDTSSGLRAMAAEITARVPQEQPQYQSSELLVGAILHGYRVAERPVIMRKRSHGVSKKGGNLLYGMRYARVLLGTWWRVRRSVRRGRSAGARGVGASDR